MKIFHTSDLHIGLKFTRGYPQELQERLVKARLETLGRMVDTANQEKCDLFVVAGDLFENPRVTKADIREAAKVLKRAESLVVILPGNHDYVQEEDDPLWPVFCDAIGDNHLLLRECRPYPLGDYGHNATLFPGVCTSRHSAENAIQWVKQAAEAAGPVTKIGIAHGSLDGVSPDFNGSYYPMTRQELHDVGIDVWLLGHTHIRYPDREQGTDERIFFPSCPEPDGFDCRHPGTAWIIELGEDRAVSFRSVVTGAFRFHDLEVPVANEADAQKLQDRFTGMNPHKDLVKLKLIGRVPAEVYETRAEFLEKLSNRVLYLEDDLSELLREIRQDDIDREFTEGSFPHRLLTELTAEQGDALALQMAYELVRDAKS